MLAPPTCTISPSSQVGQSWTFCFVFKIFNQLLTKTFYPNGEKKLFSATAISPLQTTTATKPTRQTTNVKLNASQNVNKLISAILKLDNIAEQYKTKKNYIFSSIKTYHRRRLQRRRHLINILIHIFFRFDSYVCDFRFGGRLALVVSEWVCLCYYLRALWKFV